METLIFLKLTLLGTLAMGGKHTGNESYLPINKHKTYTNCSFYLKL